MCLTYDSQSHVTLLIGEGVSVCVCERVRESTSEIMHIRFEVFHSFLFYLLFSTYVSHISKWEFFFQLLIKTKLCVRLYGISSNCSVIWLNLLAVCICTILSVISSILSEIGTFF